MSVSLSKIGQDFSNKVVQKLTLSPKLLFSNEKKWKKFRWFFDIIILKVWFWHFLSNCYSLTEIFLSFFLWVGMMVLGQKSCLLGPTILEILQPNWYYICKYHHMLWHMITEMTRLWHFSYYMISSKEYYLW